MKKILFVCMGNICRSPAAEGIFIHKIEEKNLASDFQVDSAGTIGFHSGERADARMRESALKRGYKLESRSRQITPEDLETFDLILTMDDQNFENVRRLDDGTNDYKIKKFCSYCRTHTATEVPDPYYGGDQGFEDVLNLLEDGCESLIDSLKESSN